MTTRDKNIVGEVLAKTYRIERFLGVGTVGTVYVARHVRSGGLYAVKVLHRKLAASPDLYQRFQDEARLIATLRHPHIAPITDFDRDENGIPFFAMDLLEGENLQQRLKHKETLPLAQALEIVQQVGSALHTAHRSGIVHRNLKPENIYLVRHDLGDRVTETAKITDFGLARFRRLAPAGTRDAALGVSVYMAPEMLQETSVPIDGRADQWALAVIAYRMLSGKLPFDESSPEDLLRHILNDPPRPLNRLLPDMPAHMVTALNRAMAKRREDRYETMMDFVRAFTSKSAGTAPPLPEGDSAVPQARGAMPSGRVAVTTTPMPPSGRVAATMTPMPSGRVAAPAPPIPSDAVPRPAPPIPSAAIPQAAATPSSAPVAVTHPAPPPTPAATTPTPAAVAIPRAVPIPPAATLSTSTPPPGSAATPPPAQLHSPDLLLSDNSIAPPAEPAKRPSWGLILGGTAIAILAGLGLTVVLDGRHPPLPNPKAGQNGGVTATPTPPVVEALDTGTTPVPPTPPTPPAVDAATHGPTPIAPHVPLPPLRAAGSGQEVANPAGLTPPPATPATGDPTKPTAVGSPSGTPSSAEGKPGSSPTGSKPSGTSPTSPTAANPTGSPSLPRPVLPATPTGSEPGTGSTTPEPATAPTPTPATEPKDKNTDELMKDAQAAYVRGERGRAMELALQVAEGGGPDAERAWRFIGSAACSVRNALMANKAYSQLASGEHKQMLLELCQRNGLGFQNGQFGPPPAAE